MRKELLLLPPALSLVTTPLVAVLEAHQRFFEQTGSLVVIFVGVSIAIWLGMCILASKWSWKPAFLAVEAIFYIGWLLVLAVYFISHTPIVAEVVPYYQKITLLLSGLLGIACLIKIPRKSLRLAACYLSLGFIAGDAVTFLKLDLATTDHYQPLTQVSKTTQPKHAFQFIFDAWAFQHAAKDFPEFDRRARHLAQKHNLTFYTNHFSTQNGTDRSIPDIVKVDRQDMTPLSTDSAQKNHIFEYFHHESRIVRLFGMALPYCRMYGNSLHQCEKHAGTGDLARELYQLSALYLGAISQRLPPLIFGKGVVDIVYPHTQTSLGLIEKFKDSHQTGNTQSYNTYSFLHVVLPHYPFLLSRDCQLDVDGSIEIKTLHFTGAELRKFQEQSLCALKILDGLLTHIKSIGAYENAKIVIHSDHGHISNSTAKESRESGPDSRDIVDAGHIPMWTKHPGQQSYRVVDALTSNSQVTNYLIDDSALHIERADLASFDYRFFNVNKGKTVSYQSNNGRTWAAQ